MAKKLTKKQIEKMAKEIRQFLLDNGIWQDTRIYFNGKAFATDDGKGHYYYNDPEHLVVLEDEDPSRYVEYVGTVLTMTFEGPLCGCLNYYNEYGAAFDDRIQQGLRNLLQRYGCFYELGYHWSLGVYYN